MLDDLLKNGRVELVPYVLSVALCQHEVGIAKDAEVSGDGRPGRRESLGDLTGGTWPRPEKFEDLSSGRVGEGAEDGVHGRAMGSIR